MAIQAIQVDGSEIPTGQAPDSLDCGKKTLVNPMGFQLPFPQLVTFTELFGVGSCCLGPNFSCLLNVSRFGHEPCVWQVLAGLDGNL